MVVDNGGDDLSSLLLPFFLPPLLGGTSIFVFDSICEVV